MWWYSTSKNNKKAKSHKSKLSSANNKPLFYSRRKMDLSTRHWIPQPWERILLVPPLSFEWSPRSVSIELRWTFVLCPDSLIEALPQVDQVSLPEKISDNIDVGKVDNFPIYVDAVQAGGNDFHFTYKFGRWNQFSPTKLKFSLTKFFLALYQVFFSFCKLFVISVFSFFQKKYLNGKKIDKATKFFSNSIFNDDKS